MDRKELEQALRNASKAAVAGDPAAAAAARRFAGELKRMGQMPAPTLTDKASAVGQSALAGLNDPFLGASQFVARAGRYATSLGGNYANPVSEFFDDEAKLYDRRIKEQDKAVQGARDQAGFDGVDITRVGTNIANPINVVPGAAMFRIAPAASSLGRVAFAGGTGGLIAGATAPVRNTDNYAAEKTIQSGIGFLAGAALTPAVKVASESIVKTVNRFRTAANKPDPHKLVMDALSDAGVKADEISQAAMKRLEASVAQSLKTGKQLDAAALLRKQDFDDLGLKATAGQVSRDPAQYSDEINMSKIDRIGDPLRARFQDQDALLNKKVTDFSAGSVDDSVAGDSVIGALKSVDDDMASGVRAKYQLARQSPNAGEEISMTGLAHDVGGIMHRYGKGVPDGIRNQLDDYGLLSGNQTKIFNADEAEKLLREINKQGGDKTAISALSEIRDAIKKSVTEGLGGGGPYDAARAAAAKRFGLHDTIPALKKVVDGETDSIQFIQRHIINNKNPETVRKMAGILDSDTKAQIKAQIGEYLRQKAFGQTADGQFSVARYKKALQQIGRRKLDSFFDGSEVDEMFRIGRVAEYKNAFPAGSRVNTSNTASAMYNLLRSTGSGIGDLPVLSALPKIAQGYRDRQAVSYALSGGRFRGQGITPNADRAIGLLSNNAAASGRGLLSTR